MRLYVQLLKPKTVFYSIYRSNKEIEKEIELVRMPSAKMEKKKTEKEKYL